MTDPTRRTTARDLLGPAALAAVVTYALARSFYASFPSLHILSTLPIFVLAAGEIVLSARVRAAVSHRPGARLMSALTVARCLALAKASSFVGALLLGCAAGLVGRVIPDAGRLAAARQDLLAGSVLAVATAALVGAALILEASAVDPSQRDRQP